MTPTANSVGIVIVNWNGKGLTDQFIQSIQQHTEYDNYDIIVVDNDSSDGSEQYLCETYPNVTVIQTGSNLGYVGGINEAYLQTQYDAYFLANNDCVVRTDGWLKSLVDVLHQEDVGIVAPNNDPDAPPYHGGQYQDGSYVPPDVDEPVEVDTVSGAQVLVSADVFETIGLIDEKYFPAFNEEIDFCYRAQQAGFSVVFDPRVCVEHLEGMTVDEDAEKFEIGRRHDILFRWQNYPVHRLMMEVTTDVKQVAAALLTHESGFEYLYRNLRAYAWNLRRLPSIVEGRIVRRSMPEKHGAWIQRGSDTG